MLISEIIALAEAQCDEAYTDAEWTSLVNLCLDDLTSAAKNLVPIVGKPVTVTATRASLIISSDADLAAAHEFLTVYYTPAAGTKVRLRKLSRQDNYSKGWKLAADAIALQGLGTEATGTVDLDVYKKLPHIVYDSIALTFTPTTPPSPLTDQYHGTIISFLCAKSQQREEEPEDEADFKAEYNLGKQIFANDRAKAVEPWNYKPPQAGEL